jgi:hypothetical protein
MVYKRERSDTSIWKSAKSRYCWVDMERSSQMLHSLIWPSKIKIIFVILSITNAAYFQHGILITIQVEDDNTLYNSCCVGVNNVG